MLKKKEKNIKIKKKLIFCFHSEKFSNKTIHEGENKRGHEFINVFQLFLDIFLRKKSETVKDRKKLF